MASIQRAAPRRTKQRRANQQWFSHKMQFRPLEKRDLKRPIQKE